MKICFWGNIASTLLGNTDGGSELQVALLARTLVKLKHEVVILDFQSSEDFITPDGIKVFRIKDWNKGIRIIRTISHRLPQLYWGLINQRADIYYCRIRDFRHILVFWAAHKVKAKFILQMASDIDSMSFMSRIKNFNIADTHNLWGVLNFILVQLVYPWLLRKADLVLVQHEGQQNILRLRNIKSEVFLNLIDLPETPVLTKQIQKDFIYVGWLAKRKGIVEFFDLVTKAPFHSFKVIGPPRDKIGYLYYEKLKLLSNISLLGELSHSDTMFHIANSKALISTSPMEGFPNIFIEAWSCGIPVLTLYVDPGSTIEKEGLGQVAHGNMKNLLLAMDNLKINNGFAEKAKIYVEHNHALNAKKIKNIDKLFNDLFIAGKSEVHKNRIEKG